jgi:hypothetical protein
MQESTIMVSYTIVLCVVYENTEWFLVIVGISVAYKFQPGKTK